MHVIIIINKTSKVNKEKHKEGDNTEYRMLGKVFVKFMNLTVCN